LILSMLVDDYTSTPPSIQQILRRKQLKRRWKNILGLKSGICIARTWSSPAQVFPPPRNAHAQNGQRAMAVLMMQSDSAYHQGDCPSNSDPQWLSSQGALPPSDAAEPSSALGLCPRGLDQGRAPLLDTGLAGACAGAGRSGPPP
jgi:hypothetical protein